MFMHIMHIIHEYSMCVYGYQTDQLVVSPEVRLSVEREGIHSSGTGRSMFESHWELRLMGS